MSDPESAFAEHADFDRREDGFEVTTHPFDARVTVQEEQDGLAYRVHIDLPSIDAVVVDQSVAPVVIDGWAETLERRLVDAHHATGALDDATYEFDRTEGPVRVTISFERPANAPVPADAVKTLADFAEGTYLQGIIPGYEYGPPVAGLLERAQGRGTEIRES